MRQRIILAGGSGFLGQGLAEEFRGQPVETIVLTRSPRPRVDGVREVTWDGATLGPWAQLVDGAAAVINLAGKNINCTFTPENRRQIGRAHV